MLEKMKKDEDEQEGEGKGEKKNMYNKLNSMRESVKELF